MADAGGKSSPPATPEAELSRIRHAVDDGDTDLAELGFWRLVDAVKRDPALAMRLAAEIGEIDAEAFRRRTAVRLPVWLATDAPAWAALVVLGYGLVQIVTDVLWSTKKSDWKRYARERRIAGEVTRASYTGG